MSISFYFIFAFKIIYRSKKNKQRKKERIDLFYEHFLLFFLSRETSFFSVTAPWSYILLQSSKLQWYTNTNWESGFKSKELSKSCGCYRKKKFFLKEVFISHWGWIWLMGRKENLLWLRVRRFSLLYLCERLDGLMCNSGRESE